MKIKRKSTIEFFSTFLALIMAFSFSSCSIPKKNTISVTWMDADGSLIEKSYIEKSEDFEERALPLDNDTWHYTTWKIVSSGDVIICVAQRVKKLHYIWKDYNNTILQETIGYENNPPAAPDLPISTDKWEYTEWKQDFTETSIVFTAQRLPNDNYFSGNIFQIVLKDEKGKPLSTGSGFVINSDGWFITNNHVMEGGTSAIAYFDIEDEVTNSNYVQLPIIGGSYNSDEIDIFIGKLDNYEKIKEHYRPINFTEDYTIGETTYTIGYPNSSLFMQINPGTLLEEYTDIHGKINDSYYLLSDSYIAPGSSGGILINQDFEVIGITTIGLYADSEKLVYLAGGSVPSSLFSQEIKNLNDSNLKLLTEIYY
ncbi:MAG: trypsin-like peptidase domain-containing protein [Clostridia bacterium]|nr:trypsin-like peptidase domain-containing protein [Clostridia bacterium]